MIILISASGFFVIPEYSPIKNIEYQKTPVVFHTSDERILIDGNADFATEEWPGDGTSGNPYIIEGLTITTIYTAIHISNTNVYFEIRNCTISKINQRSWSAGIILVNVVHGTILNCTIEKCYNGVGIDNSDHCSIINNTITESENGVSITDSSYCSITDNVALNNNHGFLLRDLTYCTLTNNTATNNFDGFLVFSSSNCVFIRNTVSLSNRGFSLSELTSCTLTNNTVINNDHGYYALALNKCTITNSTLITNRYEGLYLAISTNCIIANNTFVNNGIVIFGESLQYWFHDFSDNTVNSKPVGYFANLTNTIIDGSQFGQVIMVNCSEVTIKDGHFVRSSMGVQLSFCDHCFLMNSTVVDSSTNGFYLYSSNYCTLANNTATDNQYGILLRDLIECTLVNNTVIRNSFGIHLVDTSTCTITHNTLVNNGFTVSKGSISLSYWLHDLSDNTVNGKPLGYFRNQTDTVIDGALYGQVVLVNCTRVTISDGIFYNTSLGIQLSFCSGCTVINNTATGNIYGFYLGNSTDCILTSNSASSNDSGFHLYASSNCTLMENTASAGSYGYYLDWLDTCTLINNTSFNNSFTGFYLNYSSDCFLTNNTATYCKSNGFFLGWTVECLLTFNIAINNTYGIYLGVMSRNNVLYLNRLGYNSEYNALDNEYRYTNFWDDGVSIGNWWSDYDGTGTYEIMGWAYSIDHYPLQWTNTVPENDNTTMFQFTMMILVVVGFGIPIGVAVLLLLRRRNIITSSTNGPALQ